MPTSAQEHEHVKDAERASPGSRSTSRRTLMSIAPTTTPAWLPAPPRITIV